MKLGKKKGGVRCKYFIVEYRREKEFVRKVTRNKNLQEKHARNKNLQEKHDVFADSLIS